MASSSERREAIEQFCAVTGSDEDVANRYLEASDGNLEMAIGMHVDGNGSVSSEGIPPAEGSAAAQISDDENVRAPIPQKREVLVEENYTSGIRGRRRPARSVFDGFRDFQAEARQQELALAGSSVVGNGGKKRKTLEDLFRPPIDITYKGSFHSARDAGKASNKWLMVNIQNVQEFQCQVLNRDVWSHSAVKSIIKEHFILWQVYHDSEEGKKYTQFYKVRQWPYIAVLDPRTGENMVVWNKMDSTIFCDLVTTFLSEHSAMEGSSHSPPKKMRKFSIVDASEDSQLEAAIQASLNESKSPTTSRPNAELDSAISSEDDLETFTDSDSESQPSPVKSSTKSKEKNKICKTEVDLCKTTLSSKIDSCELQREDSNLSAKTNVSDKTSTSEKTDATSDSQSLEGENHSKWKEYLGSEEDPKSEIMIRFPDGKRKQWKVASSSRLMALVQYVIEHGYPNERYELVTTFPRRKLSYADFDTTLKENGLFPQETVFVQER